MIRRPPRTLLGQLVAYVIGGLAMTALHTATYWLLAELAGVPNQQANLAGAVVSGLCGFLLHNRYTFGHGRGDASARAALVKYAVVSAIVYAINAFWVWLVVTRLGGTTAQSAAPMVLATPWVAFALNRLWAFRQPA